MGGALAGMTKKKPQKQAIEKSRPTADEAREADYYARKTGMTKGEALKIIQAAKYASLKPS